MWPLLNNKCKYNSGKNISAKVNLLQTKFICHFHLKECFLNVFNSVFTMWNFGQNARWHHALRVNLYFHVEVYLYFSARNKLALLIGNWKYSHEPLTTPRNDIQDIQEKLMRLKFRVMVFTNLSKAEILGALQLFVKYIQKDDYGEKYIWLFIHLLFWLLVRVCFHSQCHKSNQH